MGFQEAPSAALEKAGLTTRGSKTRWDWWRLAATAPCLPEVLRLPPAPPARVSAREVGVLPRKSSPGPPPAADMAVDSSMELLFLDTFKHPSAEVRLRDPTSTRPVISGTPAAESGVVPAVSSLRRAGWGPPVHTPSPSPVRAPWPWAAALPCSALIWGPRLRSSQPRCWRCLVCPVSVVLRRVQVLRLTSGGMQA